MTTRKMTTGTQCEHLLLDEMETPIGAILIVTDQRARLRALDWSDYEPRMRRLLVRHYGPEGRGFELRRAEAPAQIRSALSAYFAGDRTALDDVAVYTVGTPFQQAVWTKLRDIPVGRTTSYGDLAKAVGRPKAVRAVGLANGANPIGVVVPCHRVIGGDGGLTGYAGGIDRKRWLLTHEGAL